MTTFTDLLENYLRWREALGRYGDLSEPNARSACLAFQQAKQALNDSFNQFQLKDENK